MDQKQETPQAFIKFKKHSFDSHLVKREDNNFKIERIQMKNLLKKKETNSLCPQEQSLFIGPKIIEI